MISRGSKVGTLRPCWDFELWTYVNLALRAISHTSQEPWPLLFRHSHCGKGGAGPSPLHTTLEDQQSKWIQDGCLHGTEWITFQGHLNYFRKPPLGGRPNTKPEDHGTQNSHTRWFILFSSYVRARMNRNSLKSQLVEGRSHMTSPSTRGSVTALHDFGGILALPLDTFFGLSHFHGHGSWLVCEVALSVAYKSQSTCLGDW